MIATGYTDTFARDNLPPGELWPDMAATLPELQYPDRLNCAAALLDEMVAQGFGERPAIHSYQESWTYAELLEKVDRIAHALRGPLGLEAGNRVLLRGANSPMMAACALAVLKAGCVLVPTMPLLRAKELSTALTKAKVNAVLCAAALSEEMELARGQTAMAGPAVYFGSDGADSLEALMQQQPSSFKAADTAADDVCIIGFTSGTTGVPKGTMHFHRDVLAICDCFPRSTLRTKASDVFIGTPPLAFTFGLGGLLLFPLRVGAAAVLLDRLTPDLLLKAIQDFRATICFTAPTFYRLMAPLAQAYDLSSLQKAVSAGEALPTATRTLWRESTGLEIIDGIGATEMLHIFISAAGEEVRPGATGKAIPGYQACVLGPDGKPLPPGEVGQLAVKGPTGCRYLDDARQEQYVRNGWNLTGDAYRMDQDGYFWYHARTDDMIISAGYNIAAPEVEDALMCHPAVAECAVVGWPDEERGQIVKAFVVLRQGHDASAELARALQEHVKQTVAPYKYPRAVEFLAALPRTQSGKLQRHVLRSAPAK
ncbi:AMP-binding protein [Pseudoduganella aquatica]|uniref:AMP-binding protein n=1 Tax=Pseudoduganella aquatica TaxID=2660641 RepID=A0A7X4HEZ4_9BURK|nr:AMP-binding protein [Pseudoduganella aquatica]MYN09991.1 AMP-binding protein [Pseudoduganella aquatica]